MKPIIIAAFAGCLLLGACTSPAPETTRQTGAENRQEDATAEGVPSVHEAQPEGTAAAGLPVSGAAVPVGNLPFVGRRSFETRPAVTGTGTPHRYVDILENGDVYFGYGQQDIAASSTAGERYYAGKYGRILKCEFGTIGDVRYYIVGKTAIVEVDEEGRKLVSEDCCPNEHVDMETQCPCEGGLFEAAPAP